ncbi:metal ABC transporter ATP-binding protein [Sesbania bispinosa]|nr:metal ABC transporter ATP-binding protein [Sesbania bispinosa]
MVGGGLLRLWGVRWPDSRSVEGDSRRSSSVTPPSPFSLTLRFSFISHSFTLVLSCSLDLWFFQISHGALRSLLHGSEEVSDSGAEVVDGVVLRREMVAWCCAGRCMVVRDEDELYSWISFTEKEVGGGVNSCWVFIFSMVLGNGGSGCMRGGALMVGAWQE